MLLLYIPYISLKLQHFQCGQGGFFAFVAVFAAGAVKGLLFVQGGQDAEDHGFAALEGGFSDTVGHGLTYIVKVGVSP